MHIIRNTDCIRKREQKNIVKYILQVKFYMRVYVLLIDNIRSF